MEDYSKHKEAVEAIRSQFKRKQNQKGTVQFSSTPNRNKKIKDNYFFKDFQPATKEINAPVEEEEASVKYKRISYQITFKDKLLKFIEHPAYKFFYVFVTIYVLFVQDIKLLHADTSCDLAFSIITILIMVLFFIEIIFYNIVYDEDYTCGIYFWVDLTGLASMLLDLHWIEDLLVQNLPDVLEDTMNQRTQGLVRFSRGVRIVTRAIRMIRYIKLLKLLRNSFKSPKKQAEEDLSEESKVGQKLESLLIKRIIILIFLMMIAIVFFNPTFYYLPKTQMELGLQVFNSLPWDSPIFNLTFDLYVKEYQIYKIPIFYAKVGHLEWGNLTFADTLRAQEKIEVLFPCGPSSPIQTCHAIFDNRFSITLAATLNIVKTVLICLILGGGIVCFSNDTNDLIIEPIAKMTKKIKHLSLNPIAAMQQNLNDEDAEEEGQNKVINCCANNKKKEMPLETVLLEKTISKISTLLALGFGEAGSEIISTNMQKGGDGDVNPMVAGRKVMAIYGFCDIRNFTDATEVLQEKVMIFVNEIAEIVHEITSLYCGSANKNIGDAFLLVWKLEEEFVERNEDEVKLIKSEVTGGLVDMALIAFLKIQAAVYKSHKLNQYRKHEGLCQRMPNYSVKMGFGLHLGYAIEGAIGSMFKIDASYLSPNVNVSSKLEEKTKEYKLPMILSDDFVEHLSEHARKDVRLIDQIKWEAKPDGVLRLYTCDFDLSDLPLEKEEIVESDLEDNLTRKMEKIKKIREKRKKIYDDNISGRSNPWQDFTLNDPDWIIMRSKYSPQFYDYYNSAVEHYIRGEWNMARILFEDANKLVGNSDGPIHNFLHYMHSKKYIPDIDWQGVRDVENDGH